MIDSLLPHVDNWFLPKKDYFQAFATADSRIEGWLKGEMFVLLNTLSKQGVIASYEREFNIPTSKGPKTRRQIDFRIHLQGQAHLCELKALCISQMAGTPRNLDFYFRDDEVGIVKDLKKLDDLPSREKKWVLGFVYPSPDPNEWSKTITSLSGVLDHWRCLTNPNQYQPHLFISLWRQGS